MSSLTTQPPPSIFLADIFNNWKKAVELGKGCLSCGQDCLERVKPFLSKLCDWRRGCQSFTCDVQNRELLWIFGRIRPEQNETEPVLISKQPSESASSTEQSPDGQEVISTLFFGGDQEVLNLTCGADVPKSLSQSGAVMHVENGSTLHTKQKGRPRQSNFKESCVRRAVLFAWALQNSCGEVVQAARLEFLRLFGSLYVMFAFMYAMFCQVWMWVV